MKFSLNPLLSDIFITVYAAVTLFLRFKLEHDMVLSTMSSLLVGGLFLFIIYIMIKTKVLNPNWFGLFNKKKA